MEHLGVDVAADIRMAEQRFDLGGEEQEPVSVAVIERLLAQAIPREEQPPAAPVPDGEGEHPTQMIDARLAERLVGAKQHLAVAACPEAVAPALQERSQLAEVVDLPVEDEPDRLVLVRHRLAAADRVDDRQAGHPEPETGLDVEALSIGAAVLEQRQHGRQRLRGRLANVPGDAAHARTEGTGPDRSCRPPSMREKAFRGHSFRPDPSYEARTSR